MNLSLDTLNLLALLLAQVTISPTTDDFEDYAVALAKARRELLAAIQAAATPDERG